MIRTLTVSVFFFLSAPALAQVRGVPAESGGEMAQQALVGQNHRGRNYARMMAGLCEEAIKSGDVAAFFAKNYPQAVASAPEKEAVTTDCAIYGLGKAAR
jgi:hypothetical protein